MSQITANESNYKTTEIKFAGNNYAVTVVTGRFNYINVRKLTNNPFGGIGKDFANFDAAVKHYKSPAMKTELLKIELNLL